MIIEKIRNKNVLQKVDESDIGKNGAFKVPNEIDIIDGWCFFSCKNLKEVYMGQNISSIGIGAFVGCSNLETVYMEGDITCKIYDFAFSNCKNLKFVHLSDGVKSIGKDAFSGCENLEYFFYPSTLQTFSSPMLSECKNLKKCKVSTPQTIRINKILAEENTHLNQKSTEQKIEK